jgi:hypothetical protein
MIPHDDVAELSMNDAANFPGTPDNNKGNRGVGANEPGDGDWDNEAPPDAASEQEASDEPES